MRGSRSSTALALGAILLTSASALPASGALAQSAPAALPGAPESFANIIQRVGPAVVSIDVERKGEPQAADLSGANPWNPREGQDEAPSGIDPRRFFQDPNGDDPGEGPSPVEPTKVSGSGFFISRDGYILTNNHVIEGARKISVTTTGGDKLDAHLVGRDPATDLAVLKVAGDAHPFVDFENRAKPRVGDWVVAVGNPYGLGGTATAGIVSALARPRVSGSSYVDYMQIDAPINRGNSGGPTFDVYGRVVGVNSAIFSPSGGSVGIGFDIPADVAQGVARQLIASGQVVRGYIGATVQDVTPEIAESLGVSSNQGALVADVRPDGPSARAGLRPGDLVLAIDGRPVTSSTDLTRQVALARAGAVLQLKISRDGAVRQVAVRSGVRPSDVTLASNDSDGGAGGDGHVLGMGLAANPRGGVTVEDVRADSEAGEKGLRRGDVILQAGARRTDTPSELAGAVDAARAAGRKAVLLQVRHQGQRIFVPLEVRPQRS